MHLESMVEENIQEKYIRNYKNATALDRKVEKTQQQK